MNVPHWLGAEYYFTGPIEHDLLAELIFGVVALFVIAIIWKFFKMEWPKL